MAKMIDCYGPLDAAAIARLKADGVTTVGRYIGRFTHQWDKAMTREEAKMITDAGLRIVSIWEGNPTYAAYFTMDQGLRDGADAFQDVRWLGQPENTAVYFAVDFDAQPHDLAAITAYSRGVRRSLGNYREGIYGGFRVVESITADYYYQTAAWSGGQVSKRANIYQSQINTHDAGVSVDIDEVLGEDGGWHMAYEATHAELNGKVYPAIVVGKDTYVIWTMAKDAGVKITKAQFDDVEIDGKKPPQVVQNGDTYVVWNAIPGVKPERLPDGGWNFVIETGPKILAQVKTDKYRIEYANGTLTVFDA